jgi:hypothetical protein
MSGPCSHAVGVQCLGQEAPSSALTGFSGQVMKWAHGEPSGPAGDSWGEDDNARRYDAYAREYPSYRETSRDLIAVALPSADAGVADAAAPWRPRALTSSRSRKSAIKTAPSLSAHGCRYRSSPETRLAACLTRTACASWTRPTSALGPARPNWGYGPSLSPGFNGVNLAIRRLTRGPSDRLVARAVSWSARRKGRADRASSGGAGAAGPPGVRHGV